MLKTNEQLTADKDIESQILSVSEPRTRNERARVVIPSSLQELDAAINGDTGSDSFERTLDPRELERARRTPEEQKVRQPKSFEDMIRALDNFKDELVSRWNNQKGDI